MSRASYALALVLAAACDSGGSNVAPGTTECPPCECKCECADTPAIAVDEGGESDGGTTPVSPTAAAAGDVGDLVASASRKMMHDDGKGCLADLNAVRKLDPKMDRRLDVTRGQCEMLVGRCQAGKKRIAHWYEVETAMTPERAATTAEQLGSMRCREGDSSDRDALLRALFELSDGAYMNKRSPGWCKARVTTVRKLLPKVPPKDAMDTQISGGGQALFYTAAACYAHAGDCKGAYAIYRDLFPAKGLAAIKDAKQREQMIRDSFNSSIVRCKP